MIQLLLLSWFTKRGLLHILRQYSFASITGAEKGIDCTVLLTKVIMAPSSAAPEMFQAEEVCGQNDPTGF